MKILLIEDEPFMQEAMSSVLEHKGWEVVIAASADEARQLLLSKSFNLILTDLFLPGPDGFGLVYEFKNDPRTQHIPVVVVSGLDDASRSQTKIPADDWLSKPFTLDQLKRVLLKYTGVSV